MKQAVKIPVEEFSQFKSIKHKWSAMSQPENESVSINIKKEQEDEDSLYDGKFIS